jgi:hypothetical protein
LREKRSAAGTRKQQRTTGEARRLVDGDLAVADDRRVSGTTEPERVYARVCRAINTRDWEAVADCFVEDYHSADHRVLGWEEIAGREAIVDLYRSWAATAPDMEVSFERLGGDDDHMAMRWGGRGHAAADMGGGAAELWLIQVVTVRDGRIAFTERFDEGDEGAALACLAERQSQAPDPSDVASPGGGSGRTEPSAGSRISTRALRENRERRKRWVRTTPNHSPSDWTAKPAKFQE